MNDEIGLDEDIEPTADASKGVKGGVTIIPAGSRVAALEAQAKLAEKTTSPLGGSATIAVDPLASKLA
jgi:hypothetical protein